MFTRFLAEGIGGLIAFGGFALLAGGLIALSLHAARKRRDALRAVANELHLEFLPKGEGLDLAELSQFHLTGQGHSRKASNLMRGNAQGVLVEIFDYRFTTGSGDNTSTTSKLVVRFRSPELTVPAFQMQPEHWFNKLGAALGMQDIDFAEHPVFSKAYLLKGKDEAAIRQLFDAELITSLEALKQTCVEGAGDQLLVYSDYKTQGPKEVRGFFEGALRILTRFTDAGKRTGVARAV